MSIDLGTQRSQINGHAPCVAFAQNQDGELRTSEIANTVTTTSNASARGTGKLLSGYAVRRLTPIECERLQGFPDNWTRIPYRGKPAEMCPDGPRYKALGNSWAVPCARWIFERIDKVDKL
jgi:DNA (cytosine-5)-methyltransferase 1